MPTHIVKYSSKMAFDSTMYFIIKNNQLIPRQISESLHSQNDFWKSKSNNYGPYKINNSMCNRRNSTIQPGNKEINDLLMQQINNHGSVRQIFENRHLSPFIPAGPLNQYGKSTESAE